MTSTKYIGMDVHKESISMAVMNFAGKVVMECVIETKASTILQFIHGLSGDLQITLEEGTWAAWLHDLLKPHVTKLVVCNPRQNALLKDGSKSDRIDARKLAELLYLSKLSSVYHGEHGLRMLKELSRSYLTISKDLGRVMNRLKALYRGWAIPCAGTQVYAPHYRSEWLSKIGEAGVHRRAELYYQQLDALRLVRQQARKELLAEARSTVRRSCYARFLVLVRFGRLTWLRYCRRLIGFAPSGNCGPTAVSRWRPTTARRTASWRDSYNARRNPSHCAVSIAITTTTSKIFSRARLCEPAPLLDRYTISTRLCWLRERSPRWRA